MSRIIAVVAHKLNRMLPSRLSRKLRNSHFLLAKYTALIQTNRHYIDPNYLPSTEIPEYGYFPSNEDYAVNKIAQGRDIALLAGRQRDEKVFSVIILMPEFSFPKLRQTIDSLVHQLNCVNEIQILTNEYALVKKWMSESYQLTDVDVVLNTKISGDTSSQSNFVLYCGEKLHAQALSYTHSRLHELVNITYFDTDILIDDERTLPHFYSDWNPDLLLSTAYLRTGILVPKGKHIRLKSFSFDAISEWLTQAYLHNNQLQLAHVPLVLVHRHPDTLRTITKGTDICHHFAKPEKSVSLIIPTYNGLDVLTVCIDSILQKTQYDNYKIVIVDNNSDDLNVLQYLEDIKSHSKISVIRYPKPFNYSAINNFAAKHVNSDILGLINNDIEVISENWLSNMVAHVQRPDIGCVGAKLLYPNDLVQHAGVVLGYGGGAGHAHKFFPKDHPGYLARASSTQNFSAVTAACLLVSREDYEAVDGLNETDLSIAFNDVDFCLRVLELGRRNLMCAEAILYHHESVSRGHEDTPEKQARFSKEVRYLKSKWASVIRHDPAYNPNLTLKYENFSIKLEK